MWYDTIWCKKIRQDMDMLCEFAYHNTFLPWCLQMSILSHSSNTICITKKMNSYLIQTVVVIDNAGLNVVHYPAFVIILYNPALLSSRLWLFKRCWFILPNSTSDNSKGALVSKPSLHKVIFLNGKKKNFFTFVEWVSRVSELFSSGQRSLHFQTCWMEKA